MAVVAAAAEVFFSTISSNHRCVCLRRSGRSRTHCCRGEVFILLKGQFAILGYTFSREVDEKN